MDSASCYDYKRAPTVNKDLTGKQKSVNSNQVDVLVGQKILWQKILSIRNRFIIMGIDR
jgi:hypothetical protein